MVRVLAWTGGLLCAAVILLYGLTRGSWVNALLAGVTLAMAMIPEEFPVVLTVFLALGAWRISQKGVLTRRVPAIETLGAATVLCVDKTGTLTQNRMSVGRLHAGGRTLNLTAREQSLPPGFDELVRCAMLAGRQEAIDPMEQAIRQLGDQALSARRALPEGWALVREYPLSRHLLSMSTLWRSRDAKQQRVASKGAPETLFELCHLEPKAIEELSRPLRAMAQEGFRVIGVAEGTVPPGALPESQHDFEFKFLGLVGLADPVRPAVPPAVKECYGAGIRVVMITGDYPATAQGIARQIGLRPAEELITGAELERMSDEELRDRIRTVNVFARVMPEQKLRLVNALKANGEIVAMSGDGVNDAPALRSAHIGIAMGLRGTDVAREASDLVLLEDDFSSIVQTVRLGRRIFDNLKKAMAYIIAVHVPIAGLSLIPILLRWPLVLFPVHIVFLELIIDPACSIVFEAEPEEDDVMRRPPRNPSARLVGRRTLWMSLLQGASVLLLSLIVFGSALHFHQDEAAARTLSFATLISANLMLIFTNRSWSRTILKTLRVPNPSLWWVSGGAILCLSLALFLPVVRGLFRLTTVPLHELLVSLGLGAVAVAWFEAVKVLSGKGQGISRPISGPENS